MGEPPPSTATGVAEETGSAGFGAADDKDDMAAAAPTNLSGTESGYTGDVTDMSDGGAAAGWGAGAVVVVVVAARGGNGGGGGGGGGENTASCSPPVKFMGAAGGCTAALAAGSKRIKSSVEPGGDPTTLMPEASPSEDKTLAAPSALRARFASGASPPTKPENTASTD